MIEMIQTRGKGEREDVCFADAVLHPSASFGGLYTFPTLPRFTQQMLYQICIYYCGAETDGDGSQRVTYRVDYMIRKNNGSFRRDVGSDAIRPQYVVLLVSPDGQSIAIDDVYTRS